METALLRSTLRRSPGRIGSSCEARHRGVDTGRVLLRKRTCQEISAMLSLVPPAGWAQGFAVTCSRWYGNLHPHFRLNSRYASLRRGSQWREHGYRSPAASTVSGKEVDDPAHGLNDYRATAELVGRNPGAWTGAQQSGPAEGGRLPMSDREQLENGTVASVDNVTASQSRREKSADGIWDESASASSRAQDSVVAEFDGGRGSKTNVAEKQVIGRALGEPSRKNYFPKKGEEIELVCESLAFKGLGVCKIVETGFVVMCERALPGERLMARIIKRKKAYAEAFKLRTLAPHHHAVEAPCQHFPACGGCKLQNLAYSAQLATKQQQVAELMQRVGRLGRSDPEGPNGAYMRPIEPCQEPYHYRNKMEFSFGSRVWIPFGHDQEAPPAQAAPPESPVPSPALGDAEAPAGRGGGKGRRPKVTPNPREFALGLHAPRRFDKVLPIQACLLQHEVANQVLALVQEYCQLRQHELPPYDLLTHEGNLRHLTIRTGRDAESGALQVGVNVMTKRDCPQLLRPLAEKIVAAHPQVVSVVNTVNPGVADVSTGVCEHLLFGKRTITERLRGLNFDISASSFFQTNTKQAEVLYARVEEACQLAPDGSDILLDLFCGTGTIGLSMAHRVRHVYGYELVPEAVADAQRNAEKNGIRNATFIQGDLNKLTTSFGCDFPRPNVVITDPNRPGMHPKLLHFLQGCGAARIVYVSCNPATCARDIDVLCNGEDGAGGAYRLRSVQPVDMFPQTPHVESVAVLERRASAKPHGLEATGP